METRNKSGFTLIELAIVIAIIGILAAVAVPRFQNLTGAAQQSVASSLLQSMQSSAAIYVAQQRVPPTVFNDFLVTGGAATGAKTLTLENVRSQASAISALTAASLEIQFKPAGVAKATFYLNGTDVTAAYSGF